MNQKKKAIIEKSIILFNKEGYSSPSIDKIAENAKISKMTFYRHFSDKEELVLDILSEKKIQFLSELERITENEDNNKKKLFSVFSYYDNWLSSKDFHGCMFTRAVFEYGASSPSILNICSSFKNHLYEFFKKILLNILKPEPAERVSLIIVMLIDGAIAACQSHPEPREYPPGMTAWSAAKAIIYSEGGQL